MSTGGKYIVENITNFKQDEIIYNRNLLYKRLEEKQCGPLLFWLSSTHENFVKKFYKPIIPVAYEFRREVAETGDLSWGVNRFSLQNYGDFTGQIVLSAKLSGLAKSDAEGRCAYVDFPAHKLIKSVKLEINGNTIDEYSGEAYNVWYNYFVPEDKKISWLRAVGQEIPTKAYVPHDGYREEKIITSGYQTPKPQHEDMYINIPILFDFCVRKSAGLFSSKIPFGLKFLYIELGKPEDIVYSNTVPPIMPTITGSINVENIFIDRQISDKLKVGTYKSLYRVFKETSFAAKETEVHKLDQLRFPIERLYFGLKPSVNIDPNTWWRYHETDTINVTFPMFEPPNQLVFYTDTAIRPKTTMSKISFYTKNVEIIREEGADFYNCLQPLVKDISPVDPGLMMYGFSRDSFLDDPSGSYNVSNERNFYIKYNSSIEGNIYMLAYCLNWLEIDNMGNVTLKYKSD